MSQSWDLYYLMTKAQNDFLREAEAEEKQAGGRKVQWEGHVTAPGAGASSGSHRGLGGPGVGWALALQEGGLLWCHHCWRWHFTWVSLLTILHVKYFPSLLYCENKMG